MDSPESKMCPNCGSWFIDRKLKLKSGILPRRTRQFCERRCAREFHNRLRWSVCPFDPLDKAEWRPVPGASRYEVSDDGRARSSQRWIRKELNPVVDKNGYLRISYRKDDGTVVPSQLLHRVILAVFVGPCPDGMEGAHLNGNPSDCRLSNLKWCTSLENNHHKNLHGTFNVGDKVGTAKLTNEQVFKILDLIDQGLSGAEIGRRLSVNRLTVNAIQRGDRWGEVKRMWKQQKRAEDKVYMLYPSVADAPYVPPGGEASDAA